jgi:oxygen-independent coproporphyrinogen-3 oxidase
MPTAGDIESFLQGVADEAALVDWTGPVSTVFWGGGTPGLLSARDLLRLARLVTDRTGGAPREWTVELAPASVTEARLSALRDSGVTRVSLGIQSFQPRWLDALGRKHTREQAYRAYERIRRAGFANVNLDLMFALPGQTEEEWVSDVESAASLAPEHLSTYCLTFEEDTALWVRLSQGAVRLDPEKEALLYETTWDRLGALGYEQYEISNFARPGFACLHNLNTWRMQDWIGIGPSAASQLGGLRGSNPPDLALWLSDLAGGRRMTQDRRELSQASLAEDALVFGLRMNRGVDLAAWRLRCPDARWRELEESLARLAAGGLVKQDGGIARLTRRGRLLADAVGVELIWA